jgi:hypothetical protein
LVKSLNFNYSELQGKNIEKFLLEVLKNIRKFPQILLAADKLKINLADIKDVRKSLREIYLNELVIRI